MGNKEIRELQLSRSQLVSIFVGILILGVIIFLLGISVGKKQAQLAKESGIAPEKEAEVVKEKPSPPQETAKSLISEEIASSEKIEREAKKEEKEQPTLAEQKNLYYIQVAAVNSKEAALSVAQRFKQEGFASLVLDPFPTDKKTVFRVRIGGFQTKEEAEEVRTKLISESRKKVDYFIVRY